VAQGLRQGPLVLDVGVHQLRRRVRQRRPPCGLHGEPTLMQPVGRLRLLQRSARELPVELGVDERHHVDAVDEQAAKEEVVAVDVEAANVDAAHRDTTDVGEAQDGALEARPDERCALEVQRPLEPRHRPIISSQAVSADGTWATGAPAPPLRPRRAGVPTGREVPRPVGETGCEGRRRPRMAKTDEMVLTHPRPIQVRRHDAPRVAALSVTSSARASSPRRCGRASLRPWRSVVAIPCAGGSTLRARLRCGAPRDMVTR
jgi:hypothetical protein